MADSIINCKVSDLIDKGTFTCTYALTQEGKFGKEVRCIVKKDGISYGFNTTSKQIVSFFEINKVSKDKIFDVKFGTETYTTKNGNVVVKNIVSIPKKEE